MYWNTPVSFPPQICFSYSFLDVFIHCLDRWASLQSLVLFFPPLVLFLLPVPRVLRVDCSKNHVTAVKDAADCCVAMTPGKRVGCCIKCQIGRLLPPLRKLCRENIWFVSPCVCLQDRYLSVGCQVRDSVVTYSIDSRVSKRSFCSL